MGTNERIATAVTSGVDTSALIALGWASRKNPLGVAMLRGLVAGDEQLATAVAQHKLQLIFVRMGIKKGAGYAERVAVAIVRYWLHPACRVCDGHGYEQIPGAPTLSDRSCNSCLGTGLTRMPKVAGESLDKKPWRNICNEVLNYLDDQQREAGRLVRKALT